MFPSAWTRPAAPWFALGAALVAVVAVGVGVDLSPRVEGDFFFAEDDPQLQASAAIARDFPTSPQVILRVSGEDAGYRDRIAELTAALLVVPGVDNVYSITTHDPRRSPLFGRILLTGSEGATNVILLTDGTDGEVLLPRLEEVVEGFEARGLDIVLSGEPVIVELIRRSLFRDLGVFGLTAMLVFGALVTLVYRDAGIMLGTLATSMVAVSVTLLLTRMAGVAIGLLTANLITIVFVLTLSHVVFITANWRRAASRVTRSEERAFALAAGLRDTLEGSFWSMATTLLGFCSLLVASAQPLRELGVAGALGTVTAMASAFLIYPAFLASWARPRPLDGRPAPSSALPGPSRPGLLAALGAGVIVAGLGVIRLDTDPGLLTYFKSGTELRDGLEQIDGDGGSSSLHMVVADAQGGRLDTRPVYAKMAVLQESLEADAAVGVVLSPSVLLDHAQAQPLARFLSLEMLLDIAESPQLDQAALSFVRPDRLSGLFTLRMRESAREGSRAEVSERVRGYAERVGLRAVQVGGLYDLQAQLGRLIASSLRIGIGALLLLFVLVGLVVSRSGRTTALMLLCLTGVPLVVLGTFGHTRIALDIITSPAANVALAIGVDSMIHLVVRVRRLSEVGTLPGIGLPTRVAWGEGLRQIRTPVLAASGIVCAGFGIFVLSAFPPTQRFGLAVILGTVASATMALVVLPGLALLGQGSSAPSD